MMVKRYLPSCTQCVGWMLRCVAQLVEHWSPKPGVAGSIPAASAHEYMILMRYDVIGSIPDFESDRLGSNPSISAHMPHW